MRRREFITLLGGTAATWPLAARAQQAVRVRRIGALMSIAESDSQSTVWSSAFERGLTDHGWKPGQDLQIEYRWANDENLYRRFARELLAATPEVVLAVSGIQCERAARR
jgi:putative ABC transport system substrate-binding protein